MKKYINSIYIAITRSGQGRGELYCCCCILERNMMIFEDFLYLDIQLPHALQNYDIKYIIMSMCSRNIVYYNTKFQYLRSEKDFETNEIEMLNDKRIMTSQIHISFYYFGRNLSKLKY